MPLPGIVSATAKQTAKMPQHPGTLEGCFATDTRLLELSLI